MARPLAEHTGLHVALTLPGAQENIPAASFADHLFGDLMVLVLVSIPGQLRPVFVPLKMGPHLVAAVLEVCIIRQVVAAVVLDGPDTLDLRLDGVHYPDGVDVPNKRRLPIR